MHPLALRCTDLSTKLYVSCKGVSTYAKYSPKTLMLFLNKIHTLLNLVTIISAYLNI